MTIDISQEDFGTLCVCALRYCHGRRTYMPSLVQQIVMAHFKDLSDRDLKVIADDERFQSDMSLWGDACDKVDWKNFYQTLREYKQERADNLFTDKDGDVWEWRGDAWYCISGQDEPQTDCAWK